MKQSDAKTSPANFNLEQSKTHNSKNVTNRVNSRTVTAMHAQQVATYFLHTVLHIRLSKQLADFSRHAPMRTHTQSRIIIIIMIKPR